MLTVDDLNIVSLFLQHFAGRTGRFLEVGAYDGFSYSLTSLLIERGWRGVMVEPSVRNFGWLLEHRGHNPRLSLVNAAVTVQGGLQLFHDSDEGTLSTLNPHFMENRSKTEGVSFPFRYWTNTVTPRELLDAFGGPRDWDLVIIDVEGNNWEVAREFPWAEMVDTEVACVEWDHGEEPIKDILRPFFPRLEVHFPNVIGVR